MSRARCDPRACSGSLHDDLTGHPAHLPDQGLAPFSTPLPITSSMLLDLFYSRYHVITKTQFQANTFISLWFCRQLQVLPAPDRALGPIMGCTHPPVWPIQLP